MRIVRTKVKEFMINPLSKVIDSLYLGDNITDADLIKSISTMRFILESLSKVKHSLEYRLACRALRHDLEKLEGFASARSLVIGEFSK